MPVQGYPGGLVVENLPDNTGEARDEGLIPESGTSTGGGNGNPSGILAWEVPWTEKPGGEQSMGLQRQTGLSD